MPSAKGKPTDPKLKEKVTEEIKAKPNQDGSGKGQMAAWKANQIGKEYEARGGDYENEAGSKDKPKRGPPEKKSETTKAEEIKTQKEDKAEANGAAKGDGRPKKDTAKKNIGDHKNKEKESKPKKSPRVGERRSRRQAVSAAGEKRKNADGDGKESAKKTKK